MTSRINADELTAEQRRKLGIKKQRQQKFTMEHVRRHALRVLAEISDLSQSERQRVLRHALRVNDL